MPHHSRSAAQGQFRTLPLPLDILPRPKGNMACLALYEVCPHSKQSCHVGLDEPYLHCNLPPRTSKQCIEAVKYGDRESKDTLQTTRSTLSYRPKALAANLGTPLVVLKHSLPAIRQPIRSILKPPKPSAFALDDVQLVEEMPTIYIVTFSTDLTPTTRAFAAVLNAHLPTRQPPIPLLYTIDARSFVVPAPHLCTSYSGVAEPVQDAVLEDSRAREEIGVAVEELFRFVDAGGNGNREISMSVCCTAGTHRSVAIAELVALGVRREVRRLRCREGVKIVVRHVHRVRGPKDPY
jgi:hypothetical protein